MPRSAVVDATYIVSGEPGTIRISPTPLPENSASPMGSGPGVATIGRLVDAGPGYAARTANVRLPGADVDGLAGRIVGINLDGAGGIDAERTAQVIPLHVIGEGVLGAPRTTAGGGDIEAITGHARLREALSVVRPPAMYSFGT